MTRICDPFLKEKSIHVDLEASNREGECQREDIALIERATSRTDGRRRKTPTPCQVRNRIDTCNAHPFGCYQAHGSNDMLTWLILVFGYGDVSARVIKSPLDGPRRYLTEILSISKGREHELHMTNA